MNLDRQREKKGIGNLLSFFKAQIQGGFLLIFFTLLAFVFANSPYRFEYHELSNNLAIWINDGLMSFFLLLVGLEIKKEGTVGELNTKRKALLPVIAALFGMIVPACIFLGINQHHPENYSGWAIPTATDIAFALGVLSLFRKKVPRTLFVLLAAIAIADDIGAVIVIALFYTQKLHLWALICSGLCVLILAILCMAKVRWLSIYGLIGAVLWVFLYQSGVHPSISGVLVAFMIPISREQQRSPLHILENRLHIPVNYGIVPLFIFFNAGVSFADLLPHSNLVTGIATFMHNPLVLGITLGLAIGKPLGIGGSILLLTQMKWASLPEGITRNYLFFMACLAGIGFTMAIFISDLAFPLQETLKNFAKAGILLGSITSIFVGVLSLLFGRKGS